MNVPTNPMESIVDLSTEVISHNQLRTIVAMLLDKAGYAVVRDTVTLKLYLCEKRELKAVVEGKVKP